MVSIARNKIHLDDATKAFNVPYMDAILTHLVAILTHPKKSLFHFLWVNYTTSKVNIGMGCTAFTALSGKNIKHGIYPLVK